MAKSTIFEIKLPVGQGSYTFVIKEGEGLTIIGESDSGKSALLEQIAKRGRGISYRGNKAKLSKDEKNLFGLEIGYFDGTASDSSEDRVIDVLEKAAAKFNMMPSEIAGLFGIEEIDYNSKTKKLTGFLSASTGLLSKLCKEYKFLLIDDSFGLDFGFKKKLIPFLKRVSDKYGLEYVIATTDPYMALALTPYTLMIEGKIPVEYGKSDHVLKKPTHPYAKWFVSGCKLKKDPAVAFVRTAKDAKPSRKACRFSAICPMADDTCKSRQPEFVLRGKDNLSACHKA